MGLAYRLRRPNVAFRPVQGGRLGRVPEAERRVIADDEEPLAERVSPNYRVAGYRGSNEVEEKNKVH